MAQAQYTAQHVLYIAHPNEPQEANLSVMDRAISEKVRPYVLLVIGDVPEEHIERAKALAHREAGNVPTEYCYITMDQACAPQAEIKCMVMGGVCEGDLTRLAMRCYFVVLTGYTPEEIAAIAIERRDTPGNVVIGHAPAVFGPTSVPVLVTRPLGGFEPYWSE